MTAEVILNILSLIAVTTTVIVAVVMVKRDKWEAAALWFGTSCLIAINDKLDIIAKALGGG